ncbi:XRE family transcriptional regulator [Mycobacterium adipatum]|jgi:transcriptional regulator with XRE-family HTH domain|uniref:XRE family transcriptional regulator n=1 Tax=Mycobacterium adipatum TaxID=1682113 RepID=UPI0034E06ACC
MAALVDLIDRYKNAHGATDPELARRIGITAEALRRWRTHGIRRLPQQANLDALARVIGQPYRVVLSAALHDAEYLTAEQSQQPRPHSEVMHDAIAVLTEATRLTNQPMRQTSSGSWEPNPDPRAALPIDWAEFVTRALAGAAANAGGIETVLSGRPGSWEAERVRQTLQSTVFDETDLLRHRTEPVIIDLWVEAVLADTEDTTEDDYQAAEMALSERQGAVPLPDDIPPGPFRADDPRIAEIEWVSVDDAGNLAMAPILEWPSDYADKLPLYEELLEEARNSRPDTPGEIAYERAFDEIESLSTALDAQRQADYTDYARRLTAAIESKLRELTTTVPITVTISPAPASWTSEEYDAHRPPAYSGNPIDHAVETAIMETPTPSATAGGAAPLERIHQADLSREQNDE